MKRLIFIPLGLLIIGAAMAWPAMAQTTPSQLNDIDTEKDVWITAVAIYQNMYLTDHDKYQQMLWSHSTAPTEESYPDQLGAGPDDQLETGYNIWLSCGLPVSTTYRLKIDTYNSPAGSGWVAVLETDIAGDLWQKAINFGPETYRGHDWILIDTDIF